MFDKILVALDLSKNSNIIFNEVLTLAKQIDASLILLQVLSLDDENAPNIPTAETLNIYTASDGKRIEIYREQWQNYADRSREFLQSLTDEATAAGLQTEVIQCAGNPGREICRIAQELAVDSIVLGRRGRAGLKEFILGSVSNYVVHHAPCSVLIVQGRNRSVLESIPTAQNTLVA